MRIKNLRDTQVYMGYESCGFWLKAGETSHELPDDLASNQFLKSDVEAGCIEIAGTSRKKKDKDKEKEKTAAAQPPPQPASAPAAEPAQTPKPRPEGEPADKRPDVVPDTLDSSMRKSIGMISKKDDKVKYLNEMIQTGSGASAAKAAELLVDLMRGEETSKPAEQETPRAPEPQAPVADRDWPSMTKLELCAYAARLGIQGITPMVNINDLRKMVKEKLG